MITHLLPLADLHAAAPGILDVVFGPDGDFEGAPLWVPAGWEIHPLLTDPAWKPVSKGDSLVHLWLPGYGWAFRPFDELALDLRQTTTATRLAGLCARALGAHVGDGWTLACEVHPGVLYRLVGVLTTGRPIVAGAWLSTGRSFRAESKIGDDVKNPPNAPDPAAFLAALVLTLAPRIAALGGVP